MFLENNIEVFSEKFEYQFTRFNVTGLIKVNQEYIDNTLKNYYMSSIFLLPLNKISNEIKENNWIRSVNLSTNYKDTLFIFIDEYKPIGIYGYNNKLFYFDTNGKIIDEINKNINQEKKLIVFTGPSSNLHAKSILDILNKLNFDNQYGIKAIEYINKRRWNIILNNSAILKLSESNPKISIENFIKIEKNLTKAEINNIKYFDLRNIYKTHITYK